MSRRICLQTVILAAEAIQKDSEDRGVFLEAVKANSRLEYRIFKLVDESVRVAKRSQDDN